jgi:shikimate kinase
MKDSAVTTEAGGSLPGNIYLIGLIGAGKTSVGRVLAKRFAKAFLDSYHEIERRTGVRIPMIFEIEGEAGFRDREKRMVKAIPLISPCIVSTGGGILLDESNRELLSTLGPLVYLSAPPEALAARIRSEVIGRPLSPQLH